MIGTCDGKEEEGGRRRRRGGGGGGGGEAEEEFIQSVGAESRGLWLTGLWLAAPRGGWRCSGFMVYGLWVRAGCGRARTSLRYASACRCCCGISRSVLEWAVGARGPGAKPPPFSKTFWGKFRLSLSAILGVSKTRRKVQYCLHAVECQQLRTSDPPLSPHADPPRRPSRPDLRTSSGDILEKKDYSPDCSTPSNPPIADPSACSLLGVFFILIITLLCRLQARERRRGKGGEGGGARDSGGYAISQE